MAQITWDERRSLRPSTYAWKGRLLTCRRWVISSPDRRRVCEIEHNGKGSTVDYFLYNADGHGTILTFSSASSYDLLFRRIYTHGDEECQEDVLAWVNEWRSPCSGIDGGIVLSLDEWGNEVAV